MPNTNPVRGYLTGFGSPPILEIRETSKAWPKAKKITIDGLAAMVQKEFSASHSEISELRTELKNDIGELKEGQERIELRLANVAYRFGVVDLQSRVQVLEEKMGIKPE
jgi:hypothetical protein